MGTALASPKVEPPPGRATRLEYQNLPRDLAILTGCFRIALPPQVQRDAAVLAFSIECVDRFLDAIDEGRRRARFSAAVMASLRCSVPGENNLAAEVFEWLQRLREIMGRRAIAAPFHQITAQLLANSEVMRATAESPQFVECAVREGRLMVELLLLIIGDWTTARFDEFMRRVAAPANLADKLRDVGRD